MGIADEIIIRLVGPHASEKTQPAELDFNGLQTAILQQFGFDFRTEGLDPSHMSSKEIEEALIAKAHEKYDQKETLIGSPPMRYHERMLMLQIVDSHWKDHLLAMDHLKEGIGLRGYGQRNPLVEYQKEGFEMFEALMRVMQQDVVEKVFSVQVRREQDVQQIDQQQQRPQRVMMSHGGETVNAEAQQAKRDGIKVGRNDPCPCGSGKKYKRCHGK